MHFEKGKWPKDLVVRGEGIFISDVLLPSQIISSTHELKPEKRLMAAVLEDALQQVKMNLGRTSLRERTILSELEDWLFSLDTTWPFSFLPICEALDLDSGYILRKLRKLKSLVLNGEQVSRHGANTSRRALSGNMGRRRKVVVVEKQVVT